MHRPFSAHRSLWAYLWRGIKISIVLMLLLPVFCGVQVYRSGAAALPQDYSGDAAVVLGAAAWDSRPSPVFRERINHAIVLYQSGKVRKLAFTGGAIKPGFMSEAEVGMRYAVRQGVPVHDILVEKTSRTTYENLYNIRPLLNEQGLQNNVIVSDPLHLARAGVMAEDLGMEAELSATPTTRYTDRADKIKFWLRETFLLFGYYIWRVGHGLMAFAGLGG